MVLNLIYNVVKLLLHLLLYFFNLVRWHREVGHLILKFLQQTFIFIFLIVLLCYTLACWFLSLTFVLVLCFLKIKIK